MAVCVHICLLSLLSLVRATRLVKHDVNFVPDIVLRVTLATITLNCQERLSTLVNGTYPGPPIYLEPEQTTWIRVYNDADVNTTMHWHGLSLNLFPFSDGAPMASQWPIPPGHFFDYELNVPASQAGTSFYHSHVGFQAMTASGALIINDVSGVPYSYDDEFIMELGDFYAEEDETIEAQLSGSPYIWTGDPLALQINGQSGNAPSAKNPNPSGTSCQPYAFNVAPDTTYRVRVISGTAISFVTFGIEGYDNLTIIETDNAYVYPVETDHIQIDSGQRFSFIFRTKTTAELGGQTSSWIQYETRGGSGTITAWAKLVYASDSTTAKTTVTRQDHSGDHSPDSDPQTFPSTGDSGSGLEPYSPVPSLPPSSPSTDQNPDFVPSNPIVSLPQDISSWLEYTFQSLPSHGTAPPSSSVTRRVIITTQQIVNQSQSATFPFDHDPWFDGPPHTPTTRTPYLVEILRRGTVNGALPSISRALGNGETPGFDSVTHTYPAAIGEVIEIVWQNSGSIPGGTFGIHPLHAHGGPYWDMGSGSGQYSPQAHEALLAQHGGWGGSLRDTTMLYTYADAGGEDEVVNGWRVWRIRVTESNVGVWMMHCHILQHMIMGQQTVWVFGTPDQIREYSNPVNGSLEGYFTYGGDVVGKEGGDVVVATKFA
ncbi:L-ascorbate oxidase [Exophiala spinifera]|uniref:L-ascorbate oxidase n=1 Tax=Exophiala spinifera TaxID=91928 RepID=A0A0D2BKD8_9EURO|nr:L-ascorbate oxidase [Exophiala spinifera]KIW19005.1 L-ascorbate oxidase [Exophiala spinifera]